MRKKPLRHQKEHRRLIVADLRIMKKNEIIQALIGISGLVGALCILVLLPRTEHHEDITPETAKTAKISETSETAKISETSTIDVEDVNGCIRKVDDALKKGDYTEAYLIADQMIASNNRHKGYDLNKKILTNEIATNVDEGKTAGIILCIKERARFNDGLAVNLDFYQRKAEIEMLKYALQLANVVGNGGMTKKLQNALKTWEKETE